MPNPWLLLIPFFGPLTYQQQALAEVSGLLQEQQKDPFVDPIGWAKANAPVIIGAGITAGTILGVVGMIAKAYSQKKLITEEWHDKEAPGDLDRARRQFSDARTGLKAWYGRHKGTLHKAAGLGALGAVVAATAGGFLNAPTASQGTTGAMPGALWGGTPTTSGWSSVLHGDR